MTVEKKNKMKSNYRLMNIKNRKKISFEIRSDELTFNSFSNIWSNWTNIQKIRIISILSAFLFTSNFSNSQVVDTTKYFKSDSLTLNQLIKQVVENHPSIKEAEEALNNADAKIGLAKGSYLPFIDVAGSYTRIGPVPEIDFGGKKFQMAPANNLGGYLEYNQTIFDFGKTNKDVGFITESKNLNQLSIEQIKQKISLTSITSFYTLVFIQDAIEIKDEELKTLNSHLEYVQKKKETGSATQYEILSTQVRISGVESQKIDLETSRKVQISILNSLLGQSEKTIFFVKKELNRAIPVVAPDSLISFAFAHRDEMKLALEKTRIAELQYSLTKSQTNPTLVFFAEGGLKNGYFPDLNQEKLNYAAGISLKVPIFDANHKKNNLLIAKSNIQNYNYEVDIAGRNIKTEVVQADAEYSASIKKLKQFELQLKQAERALSMAETNFKAGAITNLDLLDATRTVSESRLLLLKSKIEYVSSILKLKNAIGERLY